MKNELLLASLLTSGVVASLTVVETKALAAGGVSIASLANKGVYESAAFMHEGKEVKFRITLALPGTRGVDYTYDGRGSLDAEMFFELIDTDTYQAIDHINNSDTSYYTKRTGESTYSMFDCDSTSTCSDDLKETYKITKDANGWKVMELSSERFMGRIFNELSISEETVKAAKLNVLKEF